MAKEYAQSFYKSEVWAKTRKAYAASVGWLCEDCAKEGRLVTGKVVHHIVPITPENINDPSVTLDWSNLRLVCQDCHARLHRHGKGLRYSIMPDGSIQLL